MAVLKIYGTARSRTIRVLWLAHELGLTFEHIPTRIERKDNPTPNDYFAEGETHTEEFRRLNPNGQIPVIDDDGTIIWESLAINLYLARKYGGELWPDTVAGEGQCIQWSMWAMTAVEGPLFQYLLHQTFLPEARRDHDKASQGAASLRKRLEILDREFSRRDYLLGNRFTVADLNVASVLSWLNLSPLSLDDLPRFNDWFNHCVSRPALARALGSSA